jgi:cellulase
LFSTLGLCPNDVQQFVVDGNTYPAFDPAMDYDPKWDAKRIEYGFAKGKSGVGPVERVDTPDITCRYAPVKIAEISAEARAGSKISFQWLD